MILQQNFCTRKGVESHESDIQHETLLSALASACVYHLSILHEIESLSPERVQIFRKGANATPEEHNDRTVFSGSDPDMQSFALAVAVVKIATMKRTGCGITLACEHYGKLIPQLPALIHRLDNMLEDVPPGLLALIAGTTLAQSNSELHQISRLAGPNGTAAVSIQAAVSALRLRDDGMNISQAVDTVLQFEEAGLNHLVQEYCARCVKACERPYLHVLMAAQTAIAAGMNPKNLVNELPAALKKAAETGHTLRRVVSDSNS